MIKRSISILLIIAMMLSIFSGCGLSKENLKEKASSAKQTASEDISKARDKAGDIKQKTYNWYINLDKSKFERGWDFVSKYASSVYSATISKEYLGNVVRAIEKLKSDMNVRKGSNLGISQEAGFAAEIWHADTYNIDAAVKNVKDKASRPDSNQYASADIETINGQKASLKYYNTASKSVTNQAKNIIDDYQKYLNTSKAENKMSFEEFVDKHNYDINDIDALLESVYKDQERIIPSDQLDTAKKYIINRSVKNAENDMPKLAERDLETLNKLSDRLKSDKGVESKPLSYDEAQAIAELCQDGEFKPEDFNITLSNVVKPKYILKQSINSGAKTAALSAALSVGPDIFSILCELEKNGSIDASMLEKSGIDAFIAGSEGFVEGTVSAALLMSCQKGIMGEALKNVSPEAVGALTVLTIDAIRYGYYLSKGDIAAEDYGNLMAEDVFVTIISRMSGTALQAFLPALPMAYLAGCFVGGILASIGFNATKTIILEVKDGAGFASIIPEKTVDSFSVIPDAVEELNFTGAISNFKDQAITTMKNSKIKIEFLRND